ncbi:MAG: hypothetical protein LQ351_005045 [Letrouitia transgressa]|nr:MAG: hypothetical protein LQ351_005045 [Letrouitia transgressa]
MSHGSNFNRTKAGNVIVSEHLLGVSAEKLDTKHAAKGIAKPVDSEPLQTEAGNPKGVEQHASKTKIVEAKHRKKFIEQGFSEPDMLQRHIVTNEKDYPWCTIGKVFVGRDANFNSPIWTGSGALVGSNLLLTAGHVAPWGLPGWWMRFVPAYNNGSEPFGSSYVETYRGYHQDGEVNGLDYVICKLYTLLGNSVGWMGARSFGNDDDYYNGSWTSVGYPAEPANPGAQFMVVEEGVKIVDVDNEGSNGRELESTMYGLGGWSGGPLWAYIDDQPRIIGVMSGDETDFLQPRYTVSAGGRAMVDLILWGRSNWIV